MTEVDLVGHQARSKEGRGLSVRGGDSDKWITIQKNTFTNWINVQLQPAGLAVNDLQEDFCDGVKLCALVEALQTKKIGKVIKKPINQHQSLENVQLALNAIAADNVRLVNIGSEDIVKGSLKLILGLIWHLILRYQIGKTKFPPKKLMLAWLQAVIPDCGISNFTSDWNDGVCLHALMDYCRPGLYPNWRQLNRNSRLENCTRAMAMAKEHFNIPLIVRPEDLASPHLDDLSGMTYLSYYMNVDSPGYHATLKNVRKLLKDGHPPLNNFTTDWNDGRLLHNLVKSVGGPVAPLTNDPVTNLQIGIDGSRKLGVEPIFSAKEMADPEVEHLGIMAYAAHFTGMTPVKSQANKAYIDGDFRNVFVGQEKNFRLNIDDDVSSRNFTAEVIGPDSLPTVRLSWSGKTAVGSFTPTETGQHWLNIYCDKEPIAGCPVSIKVSSDRSKVSFHPVEKCPIGVITELKVDVTAAGQGDVRVEARSPNGRSLNLPVAYRHGVYTASFTPSEVGDHDISVKYDGDQISGSPFTVQAFDPSLVRIYGLEGGSVGRALSFNADTSKAGKGDLRVVVSHDNKKIPCYMTQESSGLHKIDFTPQGAGMYKIEAFYNEVEVRGSPYTLEIVDSSMVTVSGDGLSLVPVNRAAVFNVQTQGAGGGNVNVDITSPSGRNIPAQIIHKDGNQYKVEYTPREAGDYKINLSFCGQPVKGSPFMCKSYDAGKVVVTGMSSYSSPGIPVSFNIDASRAGSGNIEIRVNEGRVACSVVNQGNHQFAASFVPENLQHHLIEMTFNDTPVDGSPWKVFIINPQQISASGDGLHMVSIKRRANFVVHTQKAPAKDINIKIAAPDGQSVPYDIGNLESEELLVEYTPQQVGDYRIDISFGENDIAGSPYFAKSYDISAITVTPLLDGFVKTPVKFTIDVCKAGEGQLQIMVNDGTLPNEVEMHETGVYDINFIPVEPGLQKADITFNDERLPGSPFTCQAISLSASVLNLPEINPIQRETSFLIRTQATAESCISADVTVYSPNGEQVPARIVPQPDGDYKVEWTPLVAGHHSVDVLFAGQQIEGSPFFIEVFDINKIRVDNFSNGSIGDPAGFKVDCTKAGKAEQVIRVVSPSGRNVPVDITENYSLDYNVSYIPNESGRHRVYLTYGGMDLPGSPFTQEIGEGALPTAHGDGLYRAEEDKAATFFIEASGLSGEPFVQVDGPNSIAKCSIDPQPGGRFAVTYVPVEVGIFNVQVKWNGREIHGNPFHPKIVDARKVHVIGGWQHYMDSQERIQLVVHEEKRIPFDISEAGPGSLIAEVKGPNGNLPVHIDDNKTVVFTPREEGNHRIHVHWADHPLVNSPFHGYASGGIPDISKVILSGRGLKEAVIREEAEFLIDGSQAGPGDPEVQLTGVRAEVNVIVIPLGGGKFRCTYIPVIQGAYLLHITWNGRQLRGSPFKVNIIGALYPSRVAVSGEGLRGGFLGGELDIMIDTRKAGPGELTAYCMGPTRVAYCELEDNHDGRFRLTVKPQETGRHVLQIKYGGEHVRDSPFVFRVSARPDASKVVVSGTGVEHGILATFQSRFIVETRGAGAGQLMIRIRGPKGAFQVEMIRDSQKDRTILCRYDPTETGLYILYIKWSGVDVPGSPFYVHIVDTQAQLEQVLQDASYSTSTLRSYVSENQWREDI